MQSNAARIGVLVAVIAAAVVLFIVFSGGDEEDGGGDETSATPTAPATAMTEAPSEEVIRVRNGEPAGGVRSLTYDAGDRVRITVELDQPAEEVHVHGYELSESAEQSPVRLSFPADIDGLFEVEVHSHEYGDVPIAELRVNP